MKKLAVTTLIGFFVFAFCTASSAEEMAAEALKKNEPAHHALTVHHHNILHHATTLHHIAKHGCTNTNKQIAEEHAEEIGKSLEAAKKHHAKIEEHASKERKHHHTTIREHHSKATEHHEALKKELQKPTHDCSKIKHHAASLYDRIKKARDEHKAIKSKSKISEPKEPDYVQ